MSDTVGAGSAIVEVETGPLVGSVSVGAVRALGPYAAGKGGGFRDSRVIRPCIDDNWPTLGVM